MKRSFILHFVDDEKNIRESVMQFVPWGELGISRVIASKNGMDALEKMENAAPDILLTDVCMPKMDGIELASHVRKLYPDCIILFLSGYDDKDYLLSAIRLEAFQYIEKPASIEDLIEHLQGAVSRKRELMLSAEHTKELEEFHDTNLSVIHASLLASLFSHGRLTEEICSAIPGRKSSYTVFCVSFPHDTASLPSIGEQLYSALHHVALCGFYETLYFFAITSSVLKSDVQEVLSSYASGLPVLSASNLDGGSLPGIGNALCRQGASLLFYQKKGLAEYRETGYPPFPDSLESELLEGWKNTLSLQNPSAISRLLDDYHARFARSEYSAECVRDFYSKLFHLLSLTPEYQSHPAEYKDGIDTFHLMEQSETLETLSQTFHAFVESLFHDMLLYTNDSRIRQISDFVWKRLSDSQLSVSDIAHAFQLSDNYLSNYFKTKTGIPLNQYITDCRMKQARHLLIHTNDKVSDIAQKSGFSDTNYFSAVFRKSIGLSPLAFRKIGEDK